MNVTQTIPESERALYARAERRIEWLTLALGVVGALVLLAAMNWRTGAGFLVGAFLSYLNFRWIKEMATALVEAGRRRISHWTYAKIFLRYGLLGVVLYAIFTRSFLPWQAILGGLFVLIAAVLIELTGELIARV